MKAMSVVFSVEQANAEYHRQQAERFAAVRRAIILEDDNIVHVEFRQRKSLGNIEVTHPPLNKYQEDGE